MMRLRIQRTAPPDEGRRMKLRLTAYSRKLARCKPLAQRKPLVLIACCGQKLDHKARAGEIYQSDLFLKAKAWAEKFGARYMILSAKHGVLSPDTLIEPYDERLVDKTTAEHDAWDALVRDQLGLDVVQTMPIVVLAGCLYRGWIEQGDCVTVPMEGLGIGQQKAWLKNAVEHAAC